MSAFKNEEAESFFFLLEQNMFLDFVENPRECSSKPRGM